jgi:hypothetical protein
MLCLCSRACCMFSCWCTGISPSYYLCCFPTSSSMCLSDDVIKVSPHRHSPNILTQHSHPAPSPSTLAQHSHPVPSPNTLILHPHPTPLPSSHPAPTQYYHFTLTQLLPSDTTRLSPSTQRFHPGVLSSTRAHDNFLEVSGHHVLTNSRMPGHSHICLDMIILISDQILCPLLLAIMYAVVSKHTYKDSGIFILFLVAI